ncbi:hypothetical protein BHM03_00009967 [Ensete ventricosum]|nr:hypothetical protein BHM03_00009967 [Ensete ventricosum]
MVNSRNLASMIRATGELDYYSVYIRLRKTDKSENKADTTEEPREQIQTPVTLTVIIVVVLPITLVPEIASPRPRVRNYSHCLLAAKRPEFSIRGATFTRFICLAGIIRGNGSEE